MFSNVVIVGRMGADPEVKFFESGKSKTTINLAVDRPGKKDVTDWHRVEVWGKAGESLAEHAKKGDVIGVTGELQYNKFETSEGQKVTQAIISANTWRFCGGKKAHDDQEGGRSGGQVSQGTRTHQATPGDDGIPF